MIKFLLVGLGGAVGAMARYCVGALALRLAGPGWPWGTLAVNVIGGLLMGLLAGVLAARGPGGEPVRLLLGVGVLGGFTTFSAFSLEVALMIERREWLSAGAYVTASVIVSVVALVVGLWLARRAFA